MAWCSVKKQHRDDDFRVFPQMSQANAGTVP